MSELKVSIITPSFNQGRFLSETLRSVREQSYPNIEHFVIDGGSTDETLEILRAAPKVRWVSELDRGQVHALNKGFEMATGDVLTWLNSDDAIYPDTVACAVAALERTGADAVYGDLEIVDEAGKVLKMCYGIPFDFRVLLYGIDYIGQQTTFFRRELLQRAGPLREDLDNGFDYELWLRMARHGRFAYAPEIRAQFRCHAAAKSTARVHVTIANNAQIRQEYWAQGGLPAWGARRLPWFFFNWYFRLKRQFLALPQRLAQVCG